MVDFTCGNTLRVDYEVNFHIILKHFRRMDSIIHVADTGNGMLNTMILGHQAGHHIYFITICAGDKHIGSTDIRISKSSRAAGVAFNRQYVQSILDDVLALGVDFYNYYIKLIFS